MKKGWLEWTAFGLLLIGGLNWSFYALGYDLIEMTIGSSAITQTFYVIITLSIFYVGYLFVTD